MRKQSENDQKSKHRHDILWHKCAKTNKTQYEIIMCCLKPVLQTSVAIVVIKQSENAYINKSHDAFYWAFANRAKCIMKQTKRMPDMPGHAPAKPFPDPAPNKQTGIYIYR